jgi:gamma-glutamyltranspeptidase/glutathione hydrolase
MGGNAIDAAVAVGFSLAVTLPRAGNLGGVGFMLVYLKQRNEIIAVDYLGSSPRNSNIQDLFGVTLPRNYEKADRDIVRYGYKASTIPGTVAGLIEAHTNFGRLPLSSILKPVIEQARNGIRVSYDLHMALKSEPELRRDKESRKIFFKNSSAVAENTILKREDLAQTLEKIAAEGKKAFYEGEVAQKIVDAMNNNGGFISLEDLKSYKPRFSEPIRTDYRGHPIFAPRPPSGGAIVVLDALNILENFSLGKYKSNSTVTYHLLAEALRRGHMDRSRHIGDPSFYDVPVESIISKKRARELAKTISFKSASSYKSMSPDDYLEESKDTTHYSIVDEDGNAVSNTYTLGYSFGSSVTIPGTGILMNNHMNNFAYRYGDKSIRGRVASPANKFESDKRPMSTMTPVMIFNKDGELQLITGSPGGAKIPAAVLRVITGVIDFDLGIGEATMLPRIHKDWPYEDFDYETTVSSDVIAVLRQTLGHRTVPSDTMGSTQSIHIKDGFNQGYADLRRPNAGVAIQHD